MTENASDSMSEFRKLQSETTGIHLIFDKNSSCNMSGLIGNKLAKNIHDFCEKTTELSDKFNKKMIEKLQSVETSQKTELEKLKESQDQVNKKILEELQTIRGELKKIEPKPVEVTKCCCESESVAAAPDQDESVEVTGKEFDLKWIFKNISTIEDNKPMYSEVLIHFGVPWRLKVYKKNGFLNFYLNCTKDLKSDKKWLIETQFSMKLVARSEVDDVRNVDFTFGNLKNEKLYDSFGYSEFVNWQILERDFVIDGNLYAQAHVEIIKMTGVYKDKTMIFDESMEKCSDIVLDVEDRKFHVYKLLNLASTCPYFKQLLEDKLRDPENSEATITGIDPDDFQVFLEVLYGEDVDETSVEIVVLLAKHFEAESAIQKLEEFLIKKSVKTMKKKLQMAIKYSLEKLKSHCFSEIKTVDDIRSVVPEDIHETDPSILATLFEKLLELN